MSAKDFTDYIIDKANDVIDVAHELGIEFIDLDTPVDDFINDAVEAFRTRLVELAEYAQATYDY